MEWKKIFSNSVLKMTFNIQNIKINSENSLATNSQINEFLKKKWTKKWDRHSSKQIYTNGQQVY